MTTNDKPLTRNYDSDKEKSEIDSDIRVLKLDSDLQRIPAEEIASTVCRLTLFRSSSISRHALCLYGHALNINGSFTSCTYQ